MAPAAALDDSTVSGRPQRNAVYSIDTLKKLRSSSAPVVPRGGPPLFAAGTMVPGV